MGIGQGDTLQGGKYTIEDAEAAAGGADERFLFGSAR